MRHKLNSYSVSNGILEDLRMQVTIVVVIYMLQILYNHRIQKFNSVLAYQAKTGHTQLLRI